MLETWLNLFNSHVCRLNTNHFMLIPTQISIISKNTNILNHETNIYIYIIHIYIYIIHNYMSFLSPFFPEIPQYFRTSIACCRCFLAAESSPQQMRSPAQADQVRQRTSSSWRAAKSTSKPPAWRFSNWVMADGAKDVGLTKMWFESS